MTYQIDIADIDDDERIARVSESDRELLARINMLLPFLGWSEKMAAGLHAFWLIDTSHTQLCEIRGRHGFFSLQLQSVIDLIQGLSPGVKAELASDILLDDWEFDSVADSPSTLIE